MATASGAAVGALEAGVFSTPAEITASTALVVGAGVVGGAAASLGLAQAAASWVWRRVAASTGMDLWFRRATDRTDGAERKPVLDLHAGGLGVLAGGAAFVVGMSQVIPRLLHLDDEDFAPRLGVFLVSAGLVAAVGLGLVVARALLPILAHLDRKLRLPVPAAPSLRYLVYVAFPVAFGVAPFLYVNREDLGIFAVPFWVLVFIVAQGALGVCLGPVLSQRPRWARRGKWAVLLGASGATIASAWLLGQRPEIAGWVRTTTTVEAAARALRVLTDVDRDGESSLFGGRDCAPFDPAIHPLAFDEPGNGVDENCDGKDATLHVDDHPVFSDALSPEQVRHYNVVWVIVDAVRADHTSLHGYEEPTTPYLDELAGDSLVFERAFSQSSATMLSMPSMFLGRNPGSISWMKKLRVEPRPGQRLLAERLGELGYRTGIVFSKYVPKYIPSIQEGFEFRALASTVTKKSSWYSGRAGAAVTHAIDFLGEDADFPDSDVPFFLTVYIPDPHHPYDEHGFGIDDFGKGPEARYDQEIAFSDRHIGFLAGFLIYSGLWEDTIFIVTSDHGEEFGEHGGTKHASTCYRESTHVPLLVHVPGIESRRVKQPVALTDIVPTVLELVGAQDAESELDGQSLLVPALKPELTSSERPIHCSVISQRAKQGHFLRRAVRAGKWLLVHEMISGAYELYDTQSDPAEAHDMYAKMADDPAIAALRTTLARTLTGDLSQNLLTD